MPGDNRLFRLSPGKQEIVPTDFLKALELENIFS